jgi:hypothetical protein
MAAETSARQLKSACCRGTCRRWADVLSSRGARRRDRVPYVELASSPSKRRAGASGPLVTAICRGVGGVPTTLTDAFRGCCRPILPRSRRLNGPRPKAAGQETSIKLGCGSGPIADVRKRVRATVVVGLHRSDRFQRRPSGTNQYPSIQGDKGGVIFEADVWEGLAGTTRPFVGTHRAPRECHFLSGHFHGPNVVPAVTTPIRIPHRFAGAIFRRYSKKLKTNTSSSWPTSIWSWAAMTARRLPSGWRS